MKPTTISTTLYVFRGGTPEDPVVSPTDAGYETQIPVEVRGYYVPYSPATRTDPAEGGYVEDVSATVAGRPFYLTDDELELARETLAGQAEE